MNYQRKSHIEINKVYFFTATIHEFKHLLNEDINKDLIINYLKELSSKELIRVYGFVIMPNHTCLAGKQVHLIWEQLQLNGKETAQGSFLKYTAHEFLKILKAPRRSKEYEIIAANKKHQIWLRDSLSVEIYSRAVARQKLDYIHVNPVNKKWQLAKSFHDTRGRVVSCATNQGEDLNVLEETHIRLGGGPSKKGGKLTNKRYQVNDVKYKAAGETAVKPTI